jgi:hypothetical protein
VPMAFSWCSVVRLMNRAYIFVAMSPGRVGAEGERRVRRKGIVSPDVKYRDFGRVSYIPAMTSVTKAS